jgi:hypothetical protein
MDDLSKLPVNENSVASQDEEEIMEKLFTKKKGKMPWKTLGYVILAFIIFGNPYLDLVLCKIPHCENALLGFGIKVVLFIIAVFMIFKFTL